MEKLIMQPYEVLEHEWAHWNGLDPLRMVACASGTAALHLAFEAMLVPSDCRVLVPDYSMIACARAATLAGLTPTFVDCDENLLLDVGKFPLADETPVIVMPVHVYGRRCDMDAIDLWSYMSNSTTIWTIEDLAEAHGVRPKPTTDAACWSFYKNKIVHGEEGGAVYFKHEQHASYARKLRCLGFTEAHDYTHVPRGHNYRLSNCHAELILNSLERVDQYLQARRMVESWYDDFLPNRWEKMPKRQSPWVYDIRFKGMTSEQQSKIVVGLRTQGIEARHGFKQLSQQPEYRSLRYAEEVGLNPEAAAASREVIYLPIDPRMSKSTVQGIVEALVCLMQQLG